MNAQRLRQCGARDLSGLVLAPILGVAYFVYMNSWIYAHVLTPESALIGELKPDTYYHSAIASMIAFNHFVSTGLDGLVPIRYHVLSHLWMGLTARWLNVDTIHAYYLLPQIVLFPLSLFFLTTASWAISPNSYKRSHEAGSFVIVLIPIFIIQCFDVFGEVILFNSESYQLGIVIFLIFFPLLCSISASSESLFGFCLASIAGLMMLSAKVSIGFIWFSALAYAVIVSRHAVKSWHLRLLTLVIIAAGGLSLFLSAGRVEGSKFVLFSYFIDFPLGAFTDTAAVVIIYTVSVLTIVHGRSAWRVPVGLFMVLGTISFAPAILVKSEGGAAGFFSDVAVWVCVVLLSAKAISHQVLRSNAALFLLAMGVCASWAVGFGKLRAGTALGARVLAITEAARPKTAEPAAQTFVSSVGVLGSVQNALGHLSKDIEQTYGARVVEMLRHTVGYGNTKTAIFVPPDNMAFWSAHRDCGTVSLFIPALVAVPMINGLHPTCPVASYYSPEYTDESRSKELSDAELCRKAVKLDFMNVLVFRSLDEHYVLRCL
jgi:hypothetical protein